LQVPRGKGIYEDEGDSFDERDSTKSTGDDDGSEAATDTPDVEPTEEADEPTA
jgi:hypothetical protein